MDHGGISWNHVTLDALCACALSDHGPPTDATGRGHGEAQMYTFTDTFNDQEDDSIAVYGGGI